jgi:cytochrome oxidase Cu insertion factor (SCO1/SenC/PrrC family)
MPERYPCRPGVPYGIKYKEDRNKKQKKFPRGKWVRILEVIRKWVVIGLVGLALAMPLGLRGPDLAWAQGANIFQSYAKPLPLPDFSLEDLSGKMVHIKDYRGKVILLYFWATW